LVQVLGAFSVGNFMMKTALMGTKSINHPPLPSIKKMNKVHNTLMNQKNKEPKILSFNFDLIIRNKNSFPSKMFEIIQYTKVNILLDNC
jgi:hypothetical protein